MKKSITRIIDDLNDISWELKMSLLDSSSQQDADEMLEMDEQIVKAIEALEEARSICGEEEE